MKSLITVLVWAALCASGCAGAPVQPSSAPLPETVRSAPDRYVVVTVRNDAGQSSLQAAGTPRGYDGVAGYAVGPRARMLAHHIATTYGLTEAVAWPIAALGVHCVVYALPADADRANLLARLAADPRVESAQALTTFSTQSTPSYNDPYAGLQRSLDQMSVPEAQQYSRGAGIRLAVIDTGVDVNHPDLRGRIAVQRNFVDDDEPAYVTDRHGTAVAGVITALTNNRIGIAGIAPEVALLAYKACWKSLRGAGASDCNTFTLARALAAAIDADADVVNLSLAGPSDPLLARLVQRGQRRGIVFVGAAPPAGADAGFPGDVPGVISVDAPDRRSGTPAKLVAPGQDVLTLVPGAHYDFASGSSLAAAQVSAVVALVRSQQRRLDAASVQQVLASTSHLVVDASGKPFRTIDACAALVSIRQRGSCAGAPNVAVDSERGRPRTVTQAQR